MSLQKTFSHWKSIRSGLITTLEKFNDADLEFKPFPGSWSVKQIALHIAEAEDGWFRFAVNRELDQWPEYRLEEFSSIEQLKSILGTVHARTELYMQSLSDEDGSRSVIVPWGESLPLSWIIWHVLEHEIHHRGELSIILGILGREGLDI